MHGISDFEFPASLKGVLMGKKVFNIMKRECLSGGRLPGGIPENKFFTKQKDAESG